MKFIFSESGWAFFERMAYRGVIGLFYDSTLTGLLAYLIFFAVIGFAIIGVISMLKWLFTRKKKKKNYKKKAPPPPRGGGGISLLAFK